MIRQIQLALRSVLVPFSVEKAQTEALIKVDFKIGDERIALMELCFSNCSIWPLYIFAILISGTPADWNFQKLFQQNQELIFLLLDGRSQMMILTFILLFSIEFLIHQELLLLGLILYLLSKADIHLNLAFAAVVAIIFSRSVSMCFKQRKLISRIKFIWKTFSYLQLIGVLLGAAVNIFLLQTLQFQGYFSSTFNDNRTQSLLLFITTIYFFQFTLVSIWGHFYAKKVKEPTDFPTQYSSAEWLKKTRLRNSFKLILFEQVIKYIGLHQKRFEEFSALKDLSPVSIPFKITEILKTELSYLKMASSRLTVK